jgi:hypothetical protein
MLFALAQRYWQGSHRRPHLPSKEASSDSEMPALRRRGTLAVVLSSAAHTPCVRSPVVHDQPRPVPLRCGRLPLRGHCRHERRDHLAAGLGAKRSRLRRGCLRRQAATCAGLCGDQSTGIEAARALPTQRLCSTLTLQAARRASVSAIRTAEADRLGGRCTAARSGGAYAGRPAVIERDCPGLLLDSSERRRGCRALISGAWSDRSRRAAGTGLGFDRR